MKPVTASNVGNVDNVTPAMVVEDDFESGCFDILAGASPQSGSGFQSEVWSQLRVQVLMTLNNVPGADLSLLNLNVPG